MKALSLLILKNSLSSKMKKGIQIFCNNTTSTSTLRQNTNDEITKSRTLEEMIMQLEIEEEEARRARREEDERRQEILPRRMSCADGTDIMKSARNALNQYPRFSLDGRDAMYRSSFRNFADGRKSVCRSGGPRMPAVVAGERVVWCKPGVVAKLMGLDAVPVPVGRGLLNRKQSLRKMGKLELEKERLNLNLNLNLKLKNRKGIKRKELGISNENHTDWQFRRAR